MDKYITSCCGEVIKNSRRFICPKAFDCARFWVIKKDYFEEPINITKIDDLAKCPFFLSDELF